MWKIFKWIVGLIALIFALQAIGVAHLVGEVRKVQQQRDQYDRQLLQESPR